MTDVLLLNADYTPLRVLGWQKAVSMLLDKKVQLVAEYTGRCIRSPRLNLPWPAVVVQHTYTRYRSATPFNRVNVFSRDGGSCRYCGATPRSRIGRVRFEELTLDHVVPRAQAQDGLVVLPWSGRKVPVTSWENVVTACVACNRQKGARTPEQAGMRLLSLPVRPEGGASMRLVFSRGLGVPGEWNPFLV